MTPVISPWVFYAMSVVDVLKTISVMFAVIFTILAVLAIAITVMLNIDYGDKDSDYLKIKPLAKLATILAAVFILLATFIPSESTITKMIVAQNVTYERVDTVTDTVETVYNDIMELFENDEDS